MCLLDLAKGTEGQGSMTQKHARISNWVFPLLLAVAQAIASSAPATAQSGGNWLQLAELSDTTQAVGEEIGLSVAISGNTAVVAGPGIVPFGAALVYVKSPSGWGNMTQTATLTPSDGSANDAFGEAVSEYGNTIVVSAQNVSTVYLFVKPEGGWRDMTETAKLTTSVGTSRFGLALAVTQNTVVVGAYGTQGQGTAYIYVKPEGGWHDLKQTGEFLAKEKGEFGLAVAASGDTVVVGAPTAFSESGAVYVYRKPKLGWKNVKPIATLTPSDGYGEDGSNFGGAVSISGNTALVGASFAGEQRTGESYIYVRPQTGWKNMTETAELNAPSDASTFGSSVSIFGNTALIGAPYSLGQGAAYVFDKPEGGWGTTSTPTAELVASDEASDDLFGASLSISTSSALVGAFQHNELRGAAYVFGD
jgi:hypothetical protein